MKLFSTLALICHYLLIGLLPLNVMGQLPLMHQLQDKKDLNFHEVQQAFNNDWKGKLNGGKIPKGRGYKPFKRWEWFWEPRVGKEGKFPSSSVIVEEWENYLLSHPEVKKPSLKNLSLSPNNQLNDTDGGAESFAVPTLRNTSGAWKPLGPSSSFGGYSGVGRLNCVTFHPTDANTFWVGSPSGGIWKTTTGGTSWTALGDNLPVIGVSAIVVDPTNPNNMYIATGDHSVGVLNTYSVGVLKSTNGGTTWSATGLSYDVAQNILVKSLIIHPANPLILLAATSSGIYRTKNGGTTWTLEQSGNFQEILFKPGAPNTVYASSRGDAQIFRSTNNGDTWAQVTNFSGIGRIALAVTPANPSVVGALCADAFSNGFGGYYKSTNSGSSFKLTYATGKLNLLGYAKDGLDAGGQGWYDLCLAISPGNSNVVYAGGVNTWKSSNGGSSWSLSSIWSSHYGAGVPVVHADKHYMAFHPLLSGTLYQCNDGGLYKITNSGTTWTDLSNGLGITQFYRMGNSATNTNLTIAGSQDNGTKLRNSSTYTDHIGGDGMEAIIDYVNANVMYGSLYYGKIQKSTDGGFSFTDISGMLPNDIDENGSPRSAWVTPYVIDPVDNETLYSGSGRDVYKTTNGGTTWSAISNSLSFDLLQTLAVAPSNTKTIYAGGYFELYKTTNGGSSWSSITLPSNNALTSIEIHPTNPQIVWITCSGYKAGNKVFRTNNGGATWTNISGTLPNLPANTIEYDKNTGILYLGNDVGVFVLPPKMTDWQVFDTGLPNVIVTELEIQYSSGKLRAATYGRGLWESELYTEQGSDYCAPVYTSGCTNGNFINNFSFNTLVNNNSSCSNGNSKGYTNYKPTGTLTTTVYRGKSYPIKLQSGDSSPQGFGVWIDYNQDKDFEDPGEFVYKSTAAGTTLLTATIIIPAKATLGSTRMRVRSRYNTTLAGINYCTAYTYGEAEDYTIKISTIQPPTVSISSPENGATFTAPATINITANATDAGGSITKVEFFKGTTKLGEDRTAPYAYRWTGVAAGSYSLTAKATDNSGSTTTSAPVTVKVNNVTTNYCAPVYTDGCADGDYINYVKFNTLLNNNSGCSSETATGYTNYAPTGSFTTTVNKGESYTIEFQSGPLFTQGFGIWIDYNQDKDFKDAGEFVVYALPIFGTDLLSATITIPSTAATGSTRMRIRSSFEGIFVGDESCTTLDYGETEDYTIKIGTPSIVSSQANSISAQVENALAENGENVLNVTPNPFTDKVKLQFTLTKQEKVSLKIYNAQGSEVANLYEGEGEAGKPYTYEWQAKQQTAGMYIVQLTAGSKSIHKKVILIR